MAKKPTVGFYDLTGCQGCLLSFLFNEDELLDLAKHVDIKAFRFFKGAKEDKQFDLVFMEGLVANNHDLELLKAIREKTKTLVALGACACTGCIPAYRNFIDSSKYAYLVYEKAKEMKDQPPVPISNHVQVDFFIPGCPPDKKQIVTFIKDLALGKHPADYDRPVCFECRLNENRCLLDDNKMCLGPITRGGCNSICTNGKLECWGCRGPMKDANIPVMTKLLEQKGFSKDHIKQRLRTFAGMLMEKPNLITVEPKKPKAKPEKKQKKTAKKQLKAKAAKKAKKAARKILKKKLVKKVKKAKSVKKPKIKIKQVAKKVAKKAKPAKKKSLLNILKKKLKKKKN